MYHPERATSPAEAMVEANVVGAGATGWVTAAKITGGVGRVAVLDANEEHLVQERRVGIDAHANLAGLEALNSRVVDLADAMELAERRPGRDVFEELRSLAASTNP